MGSLTFHGLAGNSSCGMQHVWTHSAAPAEVQQLRKQEELQPLLKERRQESMSMHLDRSYSFQPIAVETCGSMGPESLCFLHDLGQRLKSATGENQSFSYLLQRLSVAIQTGNASSILGTMDFSSELPDFID